MTTKKFGPYSEVPAGDLRPGTWANGGSDGQLFNGLVWCYANARRNLLCLHHNVNEWVSYPAGAIGSEEWRTWLPPLDISERVQRPGTLKVWINCYCVSSTDANGIEVRVHCGDAVADFTLQGVGDSTAHWESVELDLTGVGGNDVFWIDWRVKQGGVNAVVFHSVQAYQPEDTDIASLSWINLAASYNDLCLADEPDSGLLNYILRNNLLIVRGSKVPRSNVYGHWFGLNNKTGSWGASNDDLGRYKFVKRRGVTEMKVHLLVDDSGGSSDWDVGVWINGSSQTTTVTYGSGLTWYTLTFSSLSADEEEWDLTVDADDQGGGCTMFVVGLYAIESSSSSVLHSVPDVEEALSQTEIRATRNYTNLKNTLRNLYYVAGRNIALADWRTRSSLNGAHRCQATSLGKSNYAQSGTTSDVIARALGFHSYGSTRISCRVSYVHGGTESGSYSQGLLMQLSDSLVWNTWTDVDPRNEGFRIIESFVPTADWTPLGGYMESCELLIDSADWEDEAVSPEPSQVWIQSITDNASEWLEPIAVSIEEQPLLPPEFP